MILVLYLIYFHNQLDEVLVKKKVIEWADSIFYFHEEYRFEQFHAYYTEGYQIAILRKEMYGDKLINLEKLKSKGFYKKTDEEYNDEHEILVEKNKELKKIVDNFEHKAEYYEILFWSNTLVKPFVTQVKN